ncbi:MAG: glycosyl hydrolase family 18 protein [Janthinobacterium lividum]
MLTRLLRLLTLGALGVLLAAPAAQAQFRVVGYLPSWRGEVRPTQLAQLTHVNYAFVQPTASGGLEPLANPAKLRQLVAAAHAARVRVLVSVGGWHDGDHRAFDAIGAAARPRRRLVRQLRRLVRQYSLDGVDMDWEHPNASTAAGYAALMHQLAARLHRRGQLLTAAVAGGTWAGPGILPSVFEDVDFLNIMAYDGPPPTHATYEAAAQTLTYWKGRGLPARKAVLGLPFYGQPSQESFAALVARGANPQADQLGTVGYNGLTTIRNKTVLALNEASGVMIWELAQDATGASSLLAAISQVLAQRPVPVR